MALVTVEQALGTVSRALGTVGRTTRLFGLVRYGIAILSYRIAYLSYRIRPHSTKVSIDRRRACCLRVGGSCTILCRSAVESVATQCCCCYWLHRLGLVGPFCSSETASIRHEQSKRAPQDDAQGPDEL